MTESGIFPPDRLTAARIPAAPHAGVATPPPPPPRLRRPERDQVVLRPVSLEELLPADHPARVVWAAVESLDWSAFEDAVAARGDAPGRPAVDPRVLAAVWLQGLIDHVGSGRQLAERCAHHAVYQWLCGGLAVNYHTLNDFRTGRPAALDALFTQVLGRLMHAGLVRVDTVTQDSVPVRASAGARSFGKRETLARKLADAADHVRAMGRLADESPADAAARQRESQAAAAGRRLARVTDAMAALGRAEAARGRRHDRPAAARRPAKASTTDPDARVTRMPDNGYRPAHRVQLAQDPTSRAIVGVAVDADDKAAGPRMRAQVDRRAAAAMSATATATANETATANANENENANESASAPPTVRTHVYDGNYVALAELDAAAAAGVTILAPVARPRKAGQDRYAPRPGDSPAVAAWRRRMNTPAARAAYRARASTCETVNADLTAHRGLGRLLVRGAGKVLCVALWSALAYNVMHFGAALAAGVAA